MQLDAVTQNIQRLRPRTSASTSSGRRWRTCVVIRCVLSCSFLQPSSTLFSRRTETQGPRTGQRDQSVEGHREETLNPKSDESGSVSSTNSVLHGGVKPVEVHQAECSATWLCFHGGVVKMIESRDTEGESWTHRADRVERNMRKTSGEPKESHAKDGTKSMVAGAGGKERRERGLMATRACAMRLDASTKHKRHAVA